MHGQNTVWKNRKRKAQRGVRLLQFDINKRGGGQLVVVTVSVFFISFILKLQSPPPPVPLKNVILSGFSSYVSAKTLLKLLFSP